MPVCFESFVIATSVHMPEAIIALSNIQYR